MLEEAKRVRGQLGDGKAEQGCFVDLLGCLDVYRLEDLEGQMLGEASERLSSDWREPGEGAWRARSFGDARPPAVLWLPIYDKYIYNILIYTQYNLYNLT